jgi:3,4-dihydroxy 2-butanone 4-phosphate synthase/GTP cyclohydrolase II
MPQDNEPVSFSPISEVLEDLRQGKMIVLVDDEDRENEGDLVCAAEKTTPEIINFMAKYGRGLICLPMNNLYCDRLGSEFRTDWYKNRCLHYYHHHTALPLL